jgi:hypothetical protein
MAGLLRPLVLGPRRLALADHALDDPLPGLHPEMVHGRLLGQREDVDALDPVLGGVAEALNYRGPSHHPEDAEADLGSEGGRGRVGLPGPAADQETAARRLAWGGCGLLALRPSGRARERGGREREQQAECRGRHEGPGDERRTPRPPSAPPMNRAVDRVPLLAMSSSSSSPAIEATNPTGQGRKRRSRAIRAERWQPRLVSRASGGGLYSGPGGCSKS